MPASALKDTGIEDELDILNAGQEVGVAVIDAHTDLYPTDLWVIEGRSDDVQRMLFKPAVRVDYDDDGGRLIKIRTQGPVADMLYGGVERLAFALAGIGQGAAQQFDPWVRVL